MKHALPAILIFAQLALVAAQERGSQRLAAIPLQFPDGTRLSVEVARTPQQQQIGMMFRRRIPFNTGMLFVFDQPGPQTFWMKNTLVSLDLIFISADRRITSIAAAVPSTQIDTPEQNIPRRSGVGKYVLEVAARLAAQHRLKPGDRLRFNEVANERPKPVPPPVPLLPLLNLELQAGFGMLPQFAFGRRNWSTYLHP